MNLIEGLQKEMDRNRELLEMYEYVPAGLFGAANIKKDIKDAEAAIADGDTLAMMRCYEQLKQNC